jgi:hypothetical protein
MRTPASTVAAAPIQTSFSIAIGAPVMKSRRRGLDGMAGGDQVDLVGDHHVVADVDRRVAGERASVADEDRPADCDVAPVVGVEGRDHRDALADRPSDQLFERGAHRVGFVHAVFAESCAQARRDLDAVDELTRGRRAGRDRVALVHGP